MLSAMAASTGGAGTSTTPSVARLRVIECASVKQGPQQHPAAAHDENKREHEQQVVEAEQDVLDPIMR